eukprot:5573103-Amphidinium_carterae.2
MMWHAGLRGGCVQSTLHPLQTLKKFSTSNTMEIGLMLATLHLQSSSHVSILMPMIASGIALVLALELGHWVDVQVAAIVGVDETSDMKSRKRKTMKQPSSAPPQQDISEKVQ